MDSVLIVDDEQSLGEVLVEAFSASGYRAEHAGTAEEALDRFLSSPADILIVDKNLPGMSGLDFIRRVREISYWPAIILITGYSSPESAEQALNLDVDAYLEKPFESLFGMVDLGTRLLARRRLARTAPEDPQSELFAVVAGPDSAMLALLLGTSALVETLPSAAALQARVEGQQPDLIVLQSDGMVNLPAVVSEVSARVPSATWIVLYDAPLPLQTLQELIELGVKALFDHDAYRRTVGELLERIRARKKRA